MTSKEIIARIKQERPDDCVADSEGPVDPFLQLQRDKVADVCKWLRDTDDFAFDYCSCVSGHDDKTTFWVIYHLYSIKQNHELTLKADAGREDPHVPSVTPIWAGANWHEREAYDMYGIRFDGHPDLRRILMPEDWEGFPLRKDYDFPEDYQGIPLR